MASKMMSNDTIVLQYGECCCCLEQGDHRDLTKEYYWNKEPELYEVLFKDTFAIVLRYPEDTRLICENCILKLRQSNNFRRMVESSQQNFADRVKWQMEINENVLDQSAVKVERLTDEIQISSSDVLMHEMDNQVEDLDSSVDEIITLHYSDDTDTTFTVKVERIEPEVDKKNREEVHTEEHVIADAVDINNDNLDVPMHELDNQMEELDSSVDEIVTSQYSDHIDNICMVKVQTNEHEVDKTEEVHTEFEERVIAEDVGNDSPNLDIATHGTDNQIKKMDRPVEVKKSDTKATAKTTQLRHLKVVLTRCPIVEQKLMKINFCNYCKYSTARKAHLKVHLRTHTGEKPYCCDLCKYKTARKESLKVHVRTHTGEKPFSCDHCEYRSATKRDLHVHGLTHTGEKPYVCNMCTYKTVTKRGLHLHKLTHTGEKPYSCDFCQFKSARKQNLKVHLRTHSAEKPFCCDYCHYKTSAKIYLSIHLRTHTGEKPYSCDICEFKSGRKDNLKAHMRTHSKKSYPCDLCPHKSRTKKHLKLHKRHTHNRRKRNTLNQNCNKEDLKT